MNPATLLPLLSRFAPLAGVAAVLAIVWLLGPTLAVAGAQPLAEPWQRWLATGLILLGVLLWYLVKWVLAQRREQGLQQALAGGEQGAQAIEQRLKLGFDALRKQRRSSGSMLAMPWYAVVGAPGTGKTTAIRASGLKFVARDVVGAEAYQGAGGTRHCNWWIAEEAVLLDTAGRYSYSEVANATDEAEWQRFLSTVKRFRPERPVNGVLVFFGLDHIATMSDGELVTMVGSVSARVRELAQTFGLALPVYAVFTKLDCLAGFRPLLEDLSDSECRRSLGVALDAVQEPERVRTAVEQGMAALIRNIELWTHGEVQREHNLSRSAQMIAAPLQLVALVPRIAAVMQRLAIDSAEGRLMRLRGLYLLSSVQEGALLDRVAAELDGSFGVPGADRLDARGGSRATFVEGLFREAVLPEAQLAGTDVAAVRRSALLRAVTASGIGILGLLVVLWLWGSFVQNRALVADVSAAADRYVAAAKASGAGAGPGPVLDRLEALGGVVDTAARNEPSPPFSMRAFLYQGRVLADGAGDILDGELTLGVGRRLQASLERALRGEEAESNDPFLAFGWLKAYLMLDEDYARQRDPDFLRQIADALWTREFHATPNNHERLLQQLDRLLARGLHSQAIDPALVERVRQQIGRNETELARFVYSAMESQTRIPGGQAQGLGDLLGSAGQRLFRARSGTAITIPALYTQAGASAFIGDLDGRLQAFCDAGWVLGKYMPSCDLVLGEAVRGDIRRQYAQRYIEQWDALLAAVSLTGNVKGQLEQRAGINQFLRNVWPHIDLPLDPPAPPGANPSASVADPKNDPRVLINAHFRPLSEALRGGELNRLMGNLDTIAGVIRLLDLDDAAGEVKLGPGGELSHQDRFRSSELNEAMARVASLQNPGFAEPLSSWYGAIQRAAEKLISDKRKQNAKRADAALEATAKPPQ